MLKTHLSIISLEKPVFDGEVISVTAPGAEGELTILPHHIPLVTPLQSGEIVIRHGENEEEYMAVSGGFLIVEKKGITILADSADRLEEISEEAAKAAKERAEKVLAERETADDRAFADASALLERSIAQLRLLERRKHSHHPSL